MDSVFTKIHRCGGLDCCQAEQAVEQTVELTSFIVRHGAITSHRVQFDINVFISTIPLFAVFAFFEYKVSLKKTFKTQSEEAIDC